MHSSVLGLRHLAKQFENYSVDGEIFVRFRDENAVSFLRGVSVDVA